MTETFGIIITILLGITCFLLKRFVNSIDELKKVVEMIRVELSGKNAACTEKHIALNGRIKQHEMKLNELTDKYEEHDKEITILKTK